MKPTPPGWPRMSATLYYEDPRAAIDWLCKAFGFEVQLLVEGDGGSVEHSELVFGGGLVMVGRTGRPDFPFMRAPSEIGGANTQNLFVYVDDVESHCRRAREAGAVITQELSDHDYGPEYWSDRGYGCRDVGGHHWWFSERVATAGKKA